MIIVFEGVHGCGKSTQIHLFEKWIKENSRCQTIVSKWNSFPGLFEFSYKLKHIENIGNYPLCLTHALDLNLRYELQVSPIIKNGGIALFDRYIYTAYVRDTVRGIKKQMLDEVYAFAPKPDIVFYFKISPEKALERLKASGRKRSNYILGADLNYSKDIDKNFLTYLNVQQEIYLNIIQNFRDIFVEIDGDLDVEIQFETIKKTILDRLANKLSIKQ